MLSASPGLRSQGFDTGVAIAGYTVVDGLAVSDGAPLVAYAGWLIALHSWVVPVYAVVKRGRSFWGIARRQAAWGLGGGAVSLAAYGLVLLAQTSGELAAVAALRELSIAVGVLLGATVLHEALARNRLLPALVLTAGAALTALAAIAAVGNALSFTMVSVGAGLLAGLATAHPLTEEPAPK